MFKKCPHCSETLKLLSIKQTFECSHCGAALRSNISRVELTVILVYAVTLPFNWWLSELAVEHLTGDPAGYSAWRTTVFGLGLIVVAPVYVLMLRINRQESSHDR